MGLPEEQVDLQAALRAAVMDQDISALENGLDTLVGPRGVKLSGGQMQRRPRHACSCANRSLLGL